MLYAVLGAVAQFERDVLRERTAAGMKAAKERAGLTSAALERCRVHVLPKAQRRMLAGKSHVETWHVETARIRTGKRPWTRTAWPTPSRQS
jgi:DNA invertase Pin-like site-specific DNA recombinase